MKNLASNLDKDFVNTLIDELIKKGEIFNNPPNPSPPPPSHPPPPQRSRFLIYNFQK